MEEVKEVVHVPTRELAEEVLRVLHFNDIAKGLYLADWYAYEEETCFMIHKRFGFATRETYKEHDYKIITAQEFLDRYKESELDQLRKENESLKKQLQEIQDQPKVGDVCLFWDNHKGIFMTSILTRINNVSEYKYECTYSSYKNCIKATPENIKTKINELKND